MALPMPREAPVTSTPRLTEPRPRPAPSGRARGRAVVRGAPVARLGEPGGYGFADAAGGTGYQPPPAPRATSATAVSSRSTSAAVVYGARPARMAPVSPSPIQRDASSA